VGRVTPVRAIIAKIGPIDLISRILSRPFHGNIAHI